MRINKKGILYILLFFLVGFSANYLIDKRHDRLMSKNTDKTYAIYEEVIVHYNTGPVSYYFYYIGDKKFSLNIYGRQNQLVKGDTVLIEYSKEDPSVARVIDFKYMQKFKDEKNKTENN